MVGIAGITGLRQHKQVARSPSRRKPVMFHALWHCRRFIQRKWPVNETPKPLAPYAVEQIKLFISYRTVL
jgi:hypothetical protein